MADSKKYNGSTWEHSLRKLTTATEAVENPLYSDGTAITAYTLKGNTTQSGTSTPSNLVEVNGVGVRTKNLFDKNTMTVNAYLSQSNGQYLSSTGQSYSCIIKIKPRTSYRVRTASQTMRIAFFTQYPQPNDIPTAYYNHDAMGSYAPKAYIETSGDTDTYIVVFCYNNAWEYVDGKTVDEIMLTVMVSEDTELNVPFEPYGYKIPISSAGQTIDIYIGDLPLLKSLDSTAVDEISNGTLTRRVDSDGSVLPTPTTTQITMPSIPTTEGANSITVDTTVQPSEFTATWTGWHDASVKEWDGSDWS